MQAYEREKTTKPEEARYYYKVAMASNPKEELSNS